MNEPLGDRQGQILVAIVREYIRTEDPVGSKHLVGTFNLPVSSATVRNDMARLEELGYLHQPHTSAGRVPTDSGYRFFVDNEAPVKLSAQQRRELETLVMRDSDDLEGLLKRASEILSQTTRLAAAALTPRLKESRLKHVDLAWVGPRRAVLVVIADGGRVEKRVVDFDAEVSEADLEIVERELNISLAGKTFSTAVREATLHHVLEPGAPAKRESGTAPTHAKRESGTAPTHAKRESGTVPTHAKRESGTAPAPAKRESAAVAHAKAAMAVARALAALLADDQDLTIAGTANLASNKALSEAGSFARVFEVIERRVDLQTALSDAAPPASVRIGSELPVENLQGCSLVIAPYAPGAAIGVIGPTRMEYPRMIAAVTLMAQLLGDAVQDL